jgi:hypothetical protein
MCDDQDVLTALQLHDDGLQTDHDVAIRFSAKVAVVVLVLVALCKIFWVLLLDLRVCQAVTDAGIKLIERFPLQLFKGKEPCRLYGSFQCGGPDCEFTAIADRLGNETWKSMRVSIATF